MPPSQQLLPPFFLAEPRACQLKINFQVAPASLAPRGKRLCPRLCLRRRPACQGAAAGALPVAGSSPSFAVLAGEGGRRKELWLSSLWQVLPLRNPLATPLDEMGLLRLLSLLRQHMSPGVPQPAGPPSRAQSRHH